MFAESQSGFSTDRYAVEAVLLLEDAAKQHRRKGSYSQE